VYYSTRESKYTINANGTSDLLSGEYVYDTVTPESTVPLGHSDSRSTLQSLPWRVRQCACSLISRRTPPVQKYTYIL